MLAGMDILASAGVDPSLFNSLLTSKAGSGLQQRSGDAAAAAAAANADIISSGAVAADGTARRTSSLGGGRSTGAAGGSHGTAAAAAAAAAAAGGSGGSKGNTGSGQLRGGSFRSGGGVAPGEQEAISQEDDSEPVTKGSSGKGGRSGSGGRKSGSVPGAAGGAMLGVTGGEGGADAEGDALPGAVGDNDQLDEVDYEGLMAGRLSGEGILDEAGDLVGMGAPILHRRVRHVPRQSSAINLGTRVGPAEMKRMAAEMESLRGENHLLQMQLQRLQQQGLPAGQQQQQQHAAAAGQHSPQAEGSAAGAAGAAAGASSGSRLDALEREMAVLRQQVCRGV
jgi:hypothetical protein